MDVCNFIKNLNFNYTNYIIIHSNNTNNKYYIFINITFTNFHTGYKKYDQIIIIIRRLLCRKILYIICGECILCTNGLKTITRNRVYCFCK